MRRSAAERLIERKIEDERKRVRFIVFGVILILLAGILAVCAVEQERKVDRMEKMLRKYQ